MPISCRKHTCILPLFNYLPRSCLTLVLIVKDLILVGLNPKRGVKQAPGIYETRFAQVPVWPATGRRRWVAS